MATIPQKALVPTAVKEVRQKFDLSGDNITTTDFFRLKPSKIIEVVPKDHFSVRSESLLRLFPLSKPMFGRVNHYMRWFWVPMRTLCKGWNEFEAQTVYYNSISGNATLNSKVPVLANSSVVYLFLDSLGTSPNAGRFCRVASQETPDAVLGNPGGAYDQTSVKFTPEGRAFVDLLQNLGYNINWSTLDNREMSALPLLAYFRVFADYYCSPQYLPALLPLFNIEFGEDIFQYSQLFSDLVYQFCHGFSCYDPDYFVSAWDNPVSPNVLSVNPSIDIPDVSLPDIATNAKSSVKVSSLGTPMVRRYDANPNASSLTQYIINALRATTSYCMRNNIAGYKFWDRLKAEFGVNLDYKQKGTSLYIDTFQTSIQIGEVMSNADTQGAALGDYAGRGLGYSDGKSFEFDPDNEFGYLIAVSSLVPKVDYYQGTDRINLHLTRLDFFKPEYDQLGVQPIAIQELFSSQFVGDSIRASDGTILSDVNPDRIFGYTPRYSEYKVGKSTISGDFRINSRSFGGSINAFHLMRIVANEFDDAIDQNYDGLNHDLNFVQGNNAQYDRVFANTDENYDHVYAIHHHEIHCTRAMKSLAQTIFDDEEYEHNQKAEIDYNGSQFN